MLSRLNPFKFTRAILWALWTPRYARALKQAFKDNLEMDRLATDCAVLANKDVAWINRLKKLAARKSDPLMWLCIYRGHLQQWGKEAFERGLIEDV
ncbi:MAG: hypothetical protein V3W44_10995 [Dehalococcoidales bacterium]